MKRYIKLVFVLLIFAFVSCEDYLATQSNSTFTEEVSFSNLDFATKSVYGIYDNFTGIYMYQYYLSLYYNCDNDIEMINASDDGGKRSISHYAADDGTKYLSQVWTNLYRSIERANICVDNLPLSPIWEGEHEAEAKRLYAEAVTLRALCYYELVTNWGDVPFSVKSTQAGDDYYIPKTDRDEIYEYLIKDLADVTDYLPWMRSTMTAERITRAFAKGLRARMALSYAGYSLRNKTFETRRGRNWEEYYQIANQECKEIMESGKVQLNPSFENIFRTMCSYSQDIANNEIFFEVAHGRLISGRIGHSIGMKFFQKPGEPNYGRAAGEVGTSPSYFYSFDSKDLRRDVAVAPYNYNSKSYPGQQRLVGIRDWVPTKWRKNWINPSMGGELKDIYQTGINWPLMRYADVVLMFAETENELNGPTAVAKNALTMIRERAFDSEDWTEKVTAYVDSVASSKESFFNAIVDERAWELGGEMIRKNDLVRWNLLGEKVDEMKEVNEKIINDDSEYANIPNYIFWKYKDDGESIEILNPDYRLTDSSIEGYTKTKWLSNESSSNKSKFMKNVNNVAHGYDKAKNNHLLPIAATTLTENNGVLENDQIP